MATNNRKRIPKPENETKLGRVVRYWLNSQGREYDNGWRGAYADLEHGGCASGMVGQLIYYHDTRKFYRRHQAEIAELLTSAFEDSGFYSPNKMFGDKWEKDDPLAFDATNQNILAWFGFEETARRIAQANGYED